MKAAVVGLALPLAMACGAHAQRLAYIGTEVPRLKDYTTLLTGKPVDLENVYFDMRALWTGGVYGVGGCRQEFLRLGDVVRAAGAGGFSQGQRRRLRWASLDPRGHREPPGSDGRPLPGGGRARGGHNVMPPNPGDRFAVTFGRVL